MFLLTSIPNWPRFLANRMRYKVTLLCCLLVAALLLGSCGSCSTPLVKGVVIIKYHQVGNFNRWKLLDQSGEIKDGVFLRYRIISINNTDTGAKSFRFDPDSVYASKPSEKTQPFIYLHAALPIDVGPGVIEDFEGFQPGLTIRVEGNPADLATQVQALHYASGKDEHVLMVSDTPDANTVPYFDPLTNTGS